MLPWLGPWGTGRGEAAGEPGLSTAGDHGSGGGDWSSGEETTEEPGTPAQGSSPRPRALSPSETGARPSPPSSRLAPEQAAAEEAPGPLSPQVTAPVTTSRMTPLPLWDPSHEANARPQLVGPGCGSGVSLSSRTLCHPSWPMYDAWGRIPTSGHPEERVARDAGTVGGASAHSGSWCCGEGWEGRPGRQASRLSSSGLPVTSYDDVFLLDPLLPCGQRVPLYLSKPPQQAVGARRLLLPPPIVSSSVRPSPSQACSSAWLSEAEMIALTGLLQMSQSEPRSQAPAGPLTSASCPDPAAEGPGPRGGQSCCGGTDPCPTQSPDTHCS